MLMEKVWGVLVILQALFTSPLASLNRFSGDISTSIATIDLVEQTSGDISNSLIAKGGSESLVESVSLA